MKNRVYDKNSRNEKSVFSRLSIKDYLAPCGINPNPLTYMTISNKGRETYIRTFSIDKLPGTLTFALSFERIFKFPGAVVSVFAKPMAEGTANRHLDKRVTEIETEMAASKDDSNRIRKLQGKLSRTEAVAEKIESGAETLFEVSFLISLYAGSVDELDRLTGDLNSTAKECGMDLTGVYALQAEAYLSNGPFCKMYKGAIGKIDVCPVAKKHIMTRGALSTVYSHTEARFFHKNGVPLGRRLGTDELVTYDPYDITHNGYAAVFAGMVGTGKSATIKMLVSRLEALGYRFSCVDSERKGNRGEYSVLAETLGGINLEIKTDGTTVLNPFDISEALEYDEMNEREVRTLRLKDKIADVKHIIMTMARSINGNPSFALSAFIDEILTEAISALYEEKGIVDGKPESLVTSGAVIKNGRLQGGMVKKQMPTFSDLYLTLLRQKRNDGNAFHDEAYAVIFGILKDRVKELYFDNETLQKKTKKDFEAGKKVTRVSGSKGYYDGETSVRLNDRIPFINIDISGLPMDELPIAQQIALNYINENFIKKNSENIKKAGKAVVIIDECHRMFPYEPSRRFLTDFYRTARKRNVSPWTCTQSILDFEQYDDLTAVLSNATTKFLFKHQMVASDYLKKNTALTDSQILRLGRIGGDTNDLNDRSHKGEVCMEDADRVIFVKVDYLADTEFKVVETDINRIREKGNRQ